MKARAFSPCHITGFFGIHLDEDPLKSGSSGAGVVLDKGVTTEVRAEEASEQSIEVFADSSPCDCKVTEDVVRALLGPARYRVEVDHRLEMPMMQGFGVSGAGALGTAMAVNEALGLGYSRVELGKMAHRAEVENLTGLGDIIAEMEGGFLIRKTPGAPGIGEWLKLEGNSRLSCFVVDSALETKEVLSSREDRERINAAGAECLRSLLENPSLKGFLNLSRKFSYASGLLSSRVEEAMRALEEGGVTSSMCMLGGSVLAFDRGAESLIDYPCIDVGISAKGARLL